VHRQTSEAVTRPTPPANLFVLAFYLMGGPVSDKFTNKEISRKVEIRGNCIAPLIQRSGMASGSRDIHRRIL
jgi:hypothetical protein